MKPACSVCDDVIDLAGFRGLQRIEEHGGGVRSSLLFDDRNVSPARPDFELFDCGGSERVRSTYHHVLSSYFESMCELSYCCGLTDAIHTNYQNDKRITFRNFFWRSVIHVQNLPECLFDRRP